MPSNRELAALGTVTARIVAAARRDLAHLWARLPLDDPATTRDVLVGMVPAVSDRWGQAAAAVSADWYEQVRTATGPFRVTAASPFPGEAIEARVRFGARHLWTDRPQATLGMLDSAMQRWVRQPGRDTITDATASDPAKPRWARVPRGAVTCAWCLVMASRGPVYHTEATAGGMTDWHDDCDCDAVPSWEPGDLPDRYDPDRLYDIYSDAAAHASSGDIKAVTAELRRRHPTSVTDGVAAL